MRDMQEESSLLYESSLFSAVVANDLRHQV
jgi:hypothetical protein